MSRIFLPKRWSFKPPVGTQINFGHPLANGLSAAYVLNEGGGPVYEAAGRGALGAIAGSPTWNFGSLGQQIGSFTTGSGYIDFGAIPQTQDLTLSPMTMVAWVSNESSPNGVIAGRNDGNSVGAGWVFGAKSGNWYFNREATGTNGQFTATQLSLGSSTSRSTQAAISIIDADASAQFYQDGVALSTSIASGTAGSRLTDASNPFRMGDYPAFRGGGPGPTAAWPGSIVMLLFYRRVLTASEIQELYVNPFAFVSAPKLLMWPYDPLSARVLSVNDSIAVTESATTRSILTVGVSDSVSVAETYSQQSSFNLINHAVSPIGNSSTVTTPSADTTGAGLIVLTLGRYGLGTSPVVSDSKGNAWTPTTLRGSAGTDNIQIYYCIKPTSGTGHTFTFAAGPFSFPSLCMLAFSISSGLVAHFDKENGADTSNTVPSTTPSQNDSLLVCCVETDNTVNPTVSVNSNFILTDNSGTDNVNNVLNASAYLLQATAAAVSPTFTLSAGHPFVTSMVVFGTITGMSVSDSSTLTESASFSISSNRSVSDTSTVAEVASMSIVNSANVSDSSIASESVSISIVVPPTTVSVSDISTHTESTVLSVAAKPSVFNSISVTESVSIAGPTLHFSVSDTSSVIERAYVSQATTTTQPSTASGGTSLRRMPNRNVIGPNYRSINRPRILG